MTDLTDFGGGVAPSDHSSEEDGDGTAAGRRDQYEYQSGRCRAIATSKRCRCGGAAADDREDHLCYYHGLEADSDLGSPPVTIDSRAGLLARWCGSRPMMWDELPDTCRQPLLTVDPNAAGNEGDVE